MNSPQIALTGEIATAILSGIGRELRDVTGNADTDLRTFRDCAARTAQLVREGWFDGPETFEAIEAVAVEVGAVPVHQITDILTLALASADSGDIEPAPASGFLDDFARDAARRMATAQNGTRLPTLQAVAIECGNHIRAELMTPADAGDLLQTLAETSGLADIMRADDLQHMFSQGLLGRETVATAKHDGQNGRPVASVNGERRLIIRCASDIQPEAISWFWPNRIALGKLTLIVGQPGLGKSQLTAALAAATTAGVPLPCDEGSAPFGSVLVLSAEDDPADTQVPRLLASGADCRKVHIISAVCERDAKGNRTFNLTADLDLIERELERLGDVSLITIDPLSSYLGKIDSHKNTEVRGVLEMVAEMAARRRVAVVGVTHFNKGEGSAINKVIGSIAFVAAARAAFMVAADPDDESRRLFVGMKNNIGRTAGALAFRVAQIGVGENRDILAPYIVWDSSPVEDATADQILAAATGKGSGKSTSEDAGDLLSSLLADGPRTVEDIQQEAVTAGLLKAGSLVGTDKAFRLAREALGITRKAGTVYREGGAADGGRWCWRLPTGPKLPQNAYVAPASDKGNLANSGQLSGDAAGE
jgi:putative DNA primase/helicase